MFQVSLSVSYCYCRMSYVQFCIVSLNNVVDIVTYVWIYLLLLLLGNTDLPRTGIVTSL